MSLYDDLGVAKDASAAELQAAYRRKAKTQHPDAGGDADTFARLGRAIAVLRDPAKRAEYDATGREDFREETPDQQARTLLMAEFAQQLAAFIEGRVDGRQDLLAATKAALKIKRGQQDHEIGKVKQFQRRAADALERLSHKGAGPDTLTAMLQGKMAEAGTILSGMEELAETFERAVVLADDWDWRTDPDMFADAYRASSSAGTTGWTFTGSRTFGTGGSL